MFGGNTNHSNSSESESKSRTHMYLVGGSNVFLTSSDRKERFTQYSRLSAHSIIFVVRSGFQLDNEI